MGRSVLSRPAPVPDRNVTYGPEPDNVADVYLPGAVPPLPLVVFLHGGFWRAAWDRTHVRPLAADLAARGYPVAVPEYRRTGAPGGGWPGTFDDVRAAVATLPELVGVPGPAVLAGHSAGGHLALWAASRCPARGVLALAPVTDLVEAYRLDLDAGAVAALLGGAPEEYPDRYAQADPVPPLVPATVLHGTADAQVPVAMSRSYGSRGVTLRELPGADHFGLIDPLDDVWPTVVEALRTLGAAR